MENGGRRPYALKAGEGWTYNYGIDFTVKAGELGLGRRVALVEYATRPGEEPPEHTHATEDELFYVLEGALTFRCGDETFEVDQGGFVFLPRGIRHGYTIRRDSRLLVVTAPAPDDADDGWGGFVADFEAQGEPRATPSG
ncbi:MAG TPA: cupin domain-containing protein [Actinomycetes bacterium]